MKRQCFHKLLLLSCFLLLTTLLLAQSGTISGRVTDEKNQPLQSASITIKGSSRGTTTDENGMFKLAGIPAGAQTVIVNYVGHLQQEKSIKVAGDVTVNFVVKSATADLTDVVVIGYGTAKKKDLTGSVSTISSKNFQKGSITTPEQLIAGKAPGVSITSNGGSPGAGSTIRIRGGASLNASNDPLIVIDGVPLSVTTIPGAANPLSLINPNDIESMTVLKDAASTAIYGSRASNGVIMITTKKGRKGVPVFNFSSQLSASTTAKRIKTMSADQFRDFVTKMDTASGGRYVGYLGNDKTNWQDEIYQTAITSDNNLSVSGAFNKINLPYRVSVGYLNQQGILRGDKLDRYSGAINLSPSLLQNHLKIDVNLKGTINKSNFANQTAIGNALTFDPTQSPYKAGSPFDGYYEWYSQNAAGDIFLNNNSNRNPLALLKQKTDVGTVDRSIGNIQFDYKFHFLPELRANLNLGYDVGKGTGHTDVYANSAQGWVDTGNHSIYKQNFTNTVGEFYLNYNKDIKSIKSNINATAGYGYYDNLTKVYNYAKFRDNGDTIPGSQPVFPFDEPRNTLISYYARLIYTFNNRYILAASIRSDASSRFAKDYRVGTFPSIAFTWKAKEENFLKNVNALSDLKLRLSYGVTGNQDGIGNYSYMANYKYSGNASMIQFGDTYYQMASPQSYVANLKWEQTAASNIGVDFGVLNNRLTGSVDFYYKKTKDLLGKTSIPLGSNFDNQVTANVGNITNKGVEIGINAIAIANKDINWNIGFNIAYNSTKITKLSAIAGDTSVGVVVGGISGGQGEHIQIHTVGYAPFAFYVQKQVYDVNGKPVEGAYVDLNHDGVVNDKDYYRYKSPAPQYIMGFSTQFDYRKWTMNILMRSNIGNYVYNNVASANASLRTILNTNGFTQNAPLSALETNFALPQLWSDYYVENASFLKMDNIGISYNVGKVWNEKVGVRLNANCQNVFTITKYSGLDPEIFSGIDNNVYPRPRIFLLGVNLDF